MYYYLCLIDFVSIFFKFTGTFVSNKHNNNNIYYSTYKLKLS